MAKLLKIFFIAQAVIALAALSFYYFILKPETAPSSQVFINAEVLSMDKDNHIYQAIALHGDKIVAVGSNQEIKKYIDHDTLVHDMQGKTILPGFIDAHSHFPGIGLGDFSVDLNSPPIGDITSIEQIKTRLKQALVKKKPSEWLIGYGYDDSLLKEHRHVTRDDLDQVSTEHPIFLMHVSGHFAVTNSLGLKLSGITENTKNIEGGIYTRDKNGRLTGLLEEKARIKTSELAFDMGFFTFLRMVKQGVNDYARAGVTTVQSGLVSEKVIQGLTFAKKLSLIPQDLVLWPDMQTGEDWLSGKFDAKKYQGEGVSIGAVKLVLDGSIQGYTGFLKEPYYKQAPDHATNWRGYPAMSQEALNDIVLKLHKKGLQIAAHANGDAAIEEYINAIRKAQEKFPRPDSRHIVIHAQMATKAQLQEMKEVGLTPSFFVSHVYYWGDRHRDIFLGAERAEKISPTASAEKIGLPFTLHLDTPVVPMSPLQAVWSAVNRTTSSGKLLGAEERISVMQALRAVTIDAAWQVFLDDQEGSIEVGKYANLIILDKNPLTHKKTINTIKVLKTYVRGVAIYNAAL